MKKNLLIVLAVLGFSLSTVNVNAQAFQKGNSVITAGYGFPNLGATIFRAAYGGYTGYSVSSMGPAFLKYEYALTDHIGLGLAVGYSSFTVKWNDSYSNYDPSTGNYVNGNYVWTLKYTSPSAAVRFNYHFLVKDNFEMYVGAGLGYKAGIYTYSTTDPRGTGTVASVRSVPLYMPITVGFRYYFIPNLGVYTEAGIDKGAIIQLGLAAKF